MQESLEEIQDKDPDIFVEQQVDPSDILFNPTVDITFIELIGSGFGVI